MVVVVLGNRWKGRDLGGRGAKVRGWAYMSSDEQARQPGCYGCDKALLCRIQVGRAMATVSMARRERGSRVARKRRASKSHRPAARNDNDAMVVTLA